MVTADGLYCKRCERLDYVKSGVVRGHQRYRCRGCGCNFTNTPARGKPPAMKALAILLYGTGVNPYDTWRDFSHAEYRYQSVAFYADGFSGDAHVDRGNAPFPARSGRHEIRLFRARA